MNAIKQKCRPKHQVLVLKCYPRTNKGAVDVKPNSSELSYLLFYATSRRSKIQKIGAFLEKKTASDVWRTRIGNVQVTLGILTALLEKSQKDVALISPCVLKILDLILRSNDITMIESSLPTFGAFCEHHDPSSLFADAIYAQHYAAIVQQYAQLASTQHSPGKVVATRPVQMRWRNAGLEAIKAVSSSDALASVSGRQVDVVAPIILENLWSEDEDFLDTIIQRIEMDEKADADKPLRRRMSVATSGTADTGGEPNPKAVLGSAVDADHVVEENISVLALQCLKNIFEMPNRSQIYSATGALLKFVFDKAQQAEPVLRTKETGKHHDAGWSIQMYSLIARWAPVQDRYVILVAALDTLTRLPIRDDNLDEHIVLTALIDSLLRSDVNLIGLSVMDFLLGLVKNIRKLFQLSRSGNGGAGGAGLDEKTGIETDSGPALKRKDLLARLERCVGDLATHIYYADQISDMVTAIISRLKPNKQSSASSTPQGEKTDGQEPGPGVSTVDLADSQSQMDTYFSHSQGRASALRIIKSILLVANPTSKMSGTLTLSRTRVPMQVWEGTHWLLREPQGLIRQAYVDAFTTWLERETTAASGQAHDESHIPPRSSLKNSRELPAIHTTQRAASNGSNRERHARARRSQFLPLLHLAIYDNALQYVEFDNDIVLLHILLYKLICKLGVNSVRYSLPMVYRLQEDIQELDDPAHKVRVAALCHGYFWTLTETFDFEASSSGRAIHNEVARRRSKGFWVEGVNIPPPTVDAVGTPGQSSSHREWDLSALESEEILPFDDRTTLVECVATGYEELQRSPPTSPAASPTRGSINPILSSALTSTPHGESGSELPSSFRDEMQTEWSREAVVLALASASKSESLTASKTGTLTTARNRLTINTSGLNGNGHLAPSPHGSRHNLRPQSARVHGDGERLGSMSRQRRSSVRSGVTASGSAALGKPGVASVDQLKSILSGHAPPQTARMPGADDDDDSGDSMISYDYSPSELSFNPPSQPEYGGLTAEAGSRRPPSSSPQSPHTTRSPGAGDMSPTNEANEEDDEVPPVPPLPNLSSFGHIGGMNADPTAKHSRANMASRGGESLRSHSVRSRESGSGAKSMDLQELLMGIDSRSGEDSIGNVSKPPY